ncbi:hypothetical protein [Blastomonas sp.]|uniref:hypothetical protein n=1 Tax=Blastomonas sp. TaxID=1909299 RepID=UPI00391C339F
MAMTEREMKVVQHLADAWNAYLEMREGEPLSSSIDEFRSFIHRAQDHIAARAAWRSLPEPRKLAGVTK